ncbi:hypothetical protein [Mesorhizobium sp. M0579]|uniref:hypothetical protein n=1 Tax=Mesorhizobium sp. M0579 TaxID=2956962 RepID=UPI003337F61F
MEGVTTGHGGMNIPDDQAERALLAFMAGRCAVSSQHKLPGRADILNSTTVSFIGADRASELIDKMVQDGRLIEYRPYLGDHEIDVL